jgi:arylsulfatase A-like enzyme
MLAKGDFMNPVRKSMTAEHSTKRNVSNGMNRRDFLKALGAGATSLAISGCGAATRTLSATSELNKKPNFVLILIDDLGWKDLSCYGSTFYETPNIDRLAQESMLFTNAYSACPVCSPTRAGLMTGKDTARLRFTGHITAIGRHRHPKNSRIVPPDDRMYLPLEEVTIAEVLKPAGYVSASIGKWHLGTEQYWPLEQGFDLNVAGWTHGSPPAYFYPYKNPHSKWNPSIPTLKGGKPGEYLTDRLTDEAIKFIRANKNRPFFLYLTHYAVHTPLQAPERLVSKYKAKLKTDQSQKNATYAAMIENLDANVGRVLRALEQLGLADDTVVIFTSDNGGAGSVTNNAPLRAGKGYLYEGGIRIPLFIKWSGRVRVGSISHTPVTSEDLYPTVLEIAGDRTKPPDKIDGKSLVPLLTDKGKLKREAIYWYYPHYSPQAKQPGAAIRAGDYKLIEHYDPPGVELYNLAEDIGEQVNLAEKMPQKTEQLLTKLHDWLKSVNAKMHTPNPEYKAAGTKEKS